MRLYIQMNDDIHSIEEKSQIFEIYPSNIRAVVNVEWDEDRMKGEQTRFVKKKCFEQKKLFPYPYQSYASLSQQHLKSFIQ